MTILNAGRTGVERGAYQGAVMAGLPVAGVCRRGFKDELGLMPSDLASCLVPCELRGVRTAVKQCIAMADAMLILVPDRDDLAGFPHVAWLIKTARTAPIPYRLHDPRTSDLETLAWAREYPRLYVTGPRGTQWPEGESIARRLLRSIRPIEAIA